MAFDADTGRLDIVPDAPAIGTKLRWNAPKLIEPLLPVPACETLAGGRPEKHPRREIVDAIRYVVDTGCKWRSLPADFPPWRTVWGFMARWAAAGIVGHIRDDLAGRIRRTMGKGPRAVATVIDSQSVKAAETVSRATRGYDAGKEINGRKRHLVVDTRGLPLMVMVTPASLSDRDAAKEILFRLRLTHPEITLVWADSAYAGKLVTWAKRRLNLTVKVAGAQEDGIAGVEPLGGLMLPQPVVPALGIVEAEMPVAVRVDQVGGEGQIVRARLPGLLLLAQRILRRRWVITARPSLSAPVPGAQSFHRARRRQLQHPAPASATPPRVSPLTWGDAARTALVVRRCTSRCRAGTSPGRSAGNTRPRVSAMTSRGPGALHLTVRPNDRPRPVSRPLHAQLPQRIQLLLGELVAPRLGVRDPHTQLHDHRFHLAVDRDRLTVPAPHRPARAFPLHRLRSARVMGADLRLPSFSYQLVAVRVFGSPPECFRRTVCFPGVGCPSPGRF